MKQPCHTYRYFFIGLLYFFFSNHSFCQDASIIINNGAYIRASGAKIVFGGNLQTDGNIISSSSATWVFNGTIQQKITCKTGSGCSQIYSSPLFNTVLGNVNQNNANGISIEVNTKLLGTHNFLLGTTQIKEGTYWLDNSSGPFSGNDQNSKFFITTGHGLLKQTAIGTSPTLFPIGTAANTFDYTPATLTFNGTADNFGVRVINNVYYAYDTATGDPSSIPGNLIGVNFVHKTWLVNKQAAVTSNFATTGFAATLQWNLANEDALFSANRDDDISVVRNHDTLWFPEFPLAASTPPTGLGPFIKTNTVYYDNDYYPYYPVSVSGIEKILPVTGLYLTAAPYDKNARLDWRTLTEANAGYFKVERSYDGRTFDSISNVKAFGNSGIERNYSFVDENVKASFIYYRIKEFDKDGRYIISNIATVKFISLSQTIKVYPNPVRDHFNVQFNNAPGNYTIHLLSSTRQLLLNREASVGTGLQTVLIEEARSASGFYLLRIFNKTTKEVNTVKLNILR